MTSPLRLYGLSDQWQARFDQVAVEGAQLGRVVRQDRGFVLVFTDDGQVLAATRARRSGVVVVGDWVVVQHEGVVEILERDSLLSRRDAHAEASQPIVANVDLVLIICGADRPLNVRRMERAIIQCRDANVTPVIVITKNDLYDGHSTQIQQLQEAVSGVEIISVSSRLQEGLETLYRRMANQTSVMIGESGAGKSTLLNALLEDEVVLTGDVRAKDHKGRHTTTRRELHLLPQGGALIDTPGVRALGLWADEAAVDTTFPDIAEAAEHCRFSDCAHDGEPGCALVASVEAGDLGADRVEAWKMLTLEAADAEQRRSEHERRKSEKQFSRVVDNALRRKGRRKD